MSHVRTYGNRWGLKRRRPLVSAERRLEALIEFDRIADGWDAQTRERLAGAERVILALRRRLRAEQPGMYPCEYDGNAWAPLEQAYLEVQQ